MSALTSCIPSVTAPKLSLFCEENTLNDITTPSFQGRKRKRIEEGNTQKKVQKVTSSTISPEQNQTPPRLIDRVTIYKQYYSSVGTLAALQKRSQELARLLKPTNGYDR